jgi:hypothetical protein
MTEQYMRKLQYMCRYENSTYIVQYMCRARGRKPFHIIMFH